VPAAVAIVVVAIVVTRAAVVVTAAVPAGESVGQLSPSGLKPHSGSQNSPGHHCGYGPGAACATEVAQTGQPQPRRNNQCRYCNASNVFHA